MEEQFLCKQNSQDKGFTFIEFVVVIAILCMLSASIAPRFMNNVEKAKAAADISTLKTLNKTTSLYDSINNIETGDIFSGIAADYEKIQKLVDEKLLSAVITPKQKNASFDWNIQLQNWVLSTNNYDFSQISLNDAIHQGALLPDVSSNKSMWEYDKANGVIRVLGGSDSRILFRNSKDEYTVSTLAKLGGTTNGGYGIFFDTIATNPDASDDTGYIFKFDRGMRNGAFLIRPRTNGVEGSPVIIVYADTIGLKDKDTDPAWWIAEHKVEVKVTNKTSTQRKVEAFVDGEVVLDYTYGNKLTSNDKKYSGLQGWATPTEFRNIVIK